MKDLKEYVIPVGRLGLGVHQFAFEADWSFFQHFENSPVDQGRFDVQVALDKDHDHWLATFEVKGMTDTACDRCLAPISLPISGSYVLIVKFEDEEQQETEDSDVVYVARDTHTWNVAQYIYEFILLSIPVQKTYDCEEENPPPCDFDALDRLEDFEEESEMKSNDFSEALRNIELKK